MTGETTGARRGHPVALWRSATSYIHIDESVKPIASASSIDRQKGIAVCAVVLLLHPLFHLLVCQVFVSTA
jgi:hypothetical protein